MGELRGWVMGKISKRLPQGVLNVFGFFFGGWRSHDHGRSRKKFRIIVAADLSLRTVVCGSFKLKKMHND